ncbi:Lactation elevated protein 1 [Blomia tropicalis]|nr:Lactation elevated protein 1 [Blomia tropicalis]
MKRRPIQILFQWQHCKNNLSANIFKQNSRIPIVSSCTVDGKIQQQQRYLSTTTKMVQDIRQTKSGSSSSSHVDNPTPILNVYLSRIQLGQLKNDSHQLDVIKQLQRLDDELVKYAPNENNGGVSSFIDFSLFSKFFGHSDGESDTENEPSIRGIYLHGDVGCGKTMLMDLFYENCSVDRRYKRRIHFHSFMLEFHQRLHEYKMKTKARDPSRPALNHNPIPAIADEIAEESWLLCLDEFQVTDIGDAMILKLFFKELFERGIILVATSNRHPDDLYKNGLQRSTFLPFIPMLKKHCQIYPLESGIDYRRLVTSSEHQVYFVKDYDTDSKLEIMFKVLANNETDTIRPKTLRIKGRNVTFQRTCGGVLDSNFLELCDQALGAIDYLTISQAFHTVFVRNIPVMSLQQRIQARRFITMIDTFYDHHIRVIFSADANFDCLFSAETPDDIETNDDNRKLMDDLGIQLGKSENSSASIFSGEEELFAFGRTLSRISEMQTSAYWNYKQVIQGK